MIIYLDMRRKICVSYPCFTLTNEIPESQPASGCRPGDLETLKQRGGANLVCDFEFAFGPVDDRDILENHLEDLCKIGITFISFFGLWRQTKSWSFCVKYIYFFIFFWKCCLIYNLNCDLFLGDFAIWEDEGLLK